MPYLAGFLFLFTVLSACFGFGGQPSESESTYQIFFFAFLMAFLAALVFSRRTPI